MLSCEYNNPNSDRQCLCESSEVCIFYYHFLRITNRMQFSDDLCTKRLSAGSLNLSSFTTRPNFLEIRYETD